MTIKELREAKQLSQAALAKAIGVSASAISAIEAGKNKVSEKVAAAVKTVYGEVIEVEGKVAGNKAKAAEVKAEIKATEKKVEEKAKTTAAKAKPAATKAKAAEKKVEEKAKTTAVKAKKVAAKAKATEKKVGEKAKTAAAAALVTEKKVEEKAKEKKAAKQAAKKAEVLIQSPMGGEISPEAILKKVGKVDKVYIRVDENKAYWVKGDESGSVDLW